MTRFSSTESLTSVDLFCGAGGIAEGFRQAGFNCLYGNDINPNAVQIFAANHPRAIADNRPIDEVDPLLLRKQLSLKRGELTTLLFENVPGMLLLAGNGTDL